MRKHEYSEKKVNQVITTIEMDYKNLDEIKFKNFIDEFKDDKRTISFIKYYIQ